jgi:hypothetical protein
MKRNLVLVMRMIDGMDSKTWSVYPVTAFTRFEALNKLGQNCLLEQ